MLQPCPALQYSKYELKLELYEDPILPLAALLRASLGVFVEHSCVRWEGEL